MSAPPSLGLESALAAPAAAGPALGAPASVLAPVPASPFGSLQAFPAAAEAGATPTAPAGPAFTPVPQAEPASSPFTPVARYTVADPAAGDSPAFDELMADLPSRRGAREHAAPTPGARMRGLFGRRPDETATSAIPLRRTDALGASALGAPAPAPAVPSFDDSRFVPFGTTPGPAPVVEPAPAAPASYQPSAPEGPGWGAASSSTGGGGSALPLRSSTPTRDPLADPLDPHAIPDTVEARSEWMASAVLYEEMSSLLRRGVFEEQRVTPTQDEDTYRPVAVAAAEAPELTRRAARATVNPAVDRFTARIERDPEQLRSRLSAFQSATARDRSAGENEGPSTWAPAP